MPQVEPSLTASLAECLREFGGGSNVALYSNSAGLEQYDPHGEAVMSCKSSRVLQVEHFNSAGLV